MYKTDLVSKITVLMLLIVIIIDLACVGTQVTNLNKSLYHEDLFVHRKALVDSLNFTKKNDEIVDNNELVDTINDLYSDPLLDNKISLYTIQAYIGPVRSEAIRCKQYLYSLRSPYILQFNYVEPNYIVTIGAFTDKVYAQSLFKKIKSVLPKAILRNMDFNNDSNFIEQIIYLEKESI